MFIFKQGNLFYEINKTEAIINTVNCRGVMGKGIANEFKKRYPLMFKEYKEKCVVGDIKIGKNHIYKMPTNEITKYIINFPTKDDWRKDSKIEYIKQGLDDLIIVIKKYGIKSIAMPALGCGNGNLDWEIVKPLIVNKLGHLKSVEIIIYEPSLKVGNNKKEKVLKPRLTIERKILLLLMNAYQEVKNNHPITYKEINALSYIMQNDNKRIKFDLRSFGPYSSDINNLIKSLAKYYIKPLPKTNSDDATPIEIVSLDFPQKATIEKSKEFKYYKDLLKGFELRENLLILTISLWMYKEHRVFGEELLTLTNNWLEKNTDNVDIEMVRKAISRIERVYMNVDELKLDL
ncbi:macro domain-containing protein [Lysinibacillus capsici]|uniref:type II toxin-antitoxin system antitoxin DNA ADP-ribosyl glycohydrolase DarG n=1 Tax=Lysinibacillus capsici TaxID=2115968 RepID=UPI002E1F8B47|nr:macro domain-containing protein [Lysinibacillus capsici]